MNSELREFGGSSTPRRGPVPDVSQQGNRRAEVGRDIVAAAYLRGDFVLPSGEHSDFYFDKYLFETKPTILRRLGEMVAEVLPARLDRVAGAASGGIALATAVSLHTGLPFVILRPGREPGVLGELHPGERVAVVTDVVDSGQQASDATSVATNSGAQVLALVSIIDRGAGGEARLAAAGIHYEPLYRLADLDL